MTKEIETDLARGIYRATPRAQAVAGMLGKAGMQAVRRNSHIQEQLRL